LAEIWSKVCCESIFTVSHLFWMISVLFWRVNPWGHG
jgi:hypothetical protein